MTLEPWLLPTLMSVVLWGVSMFLPGIVIKRLPPFHMTVYSYAFFMIGSLVMQAFYGFNIAFEPRGVLLALAVGVVGGFAQILYNLSLRTSTLTYSVVLTSLYPVVATLLAFFILHETLTPRQIAGLALGIFSLILMVKTGDKKNNG